MSNEDRKFRVWIGCLGCYNEGRLAGDWFDADNLPANEAEWLEGLDSKPKPHGFGMTHEELWCMDTENAPVDGEMGVNDAQRYADWLAPLDCEVSDELAAYLAHVGTFDEDTIKAFQESYKGVFDEMADAFEDLYPESDLPDWAKPHRWEILRSKVEEFETSGWWTEPAGGGKVHVFSD